MLDKVINKTFTLGGSKAWSSTDIIKICEKFSGQSASVANTPTFILRIVRIFINFFEWGWNIADRLAFIEIFSKASYFSISVNNMNKIFRFNPDELFYLDTYLQEYFEQILIKLKDLGTTLQKSIFLIFLKSLTKILNFEFKVFSLILFDEKLIFFIILLFELTKKTLVSELPISP